MCYMDLLVGLNGGKLQDIYILQNAVLSSGTGSGMALRLRTGRFVVRTVQYLPSASSTPHPKFHNGSQDA